MFNDTNTTYVDIDNLVNNVASKIKTIEMLKLEILSNTNLLFQSMGGDHMEAAEAVGETLASLIISSYRLGCSLGIEAEDMDRRIRMKVDVLKTINYHAPTMDVIALDKKFK